MSWQKGNENLVVMALTRKRLICFLVALSQLYKKFGHYEVV